MSDEKQVNDDGPPWSIWAPTETAPPMSDAMRYVLPRRGVSLKDLEEEMARRERKFKIGDFVIVPKDEDHGELLSVIYKDATDDYMISRRNAQRMFGADPGPMVGLRVFSLKVAYALKECWAETKLRKATAEEIEVHKAAVRAAYGLLALPMFKVGEKVVFEEEAALVVPGFFGSQTIVLPKDTEAVVDTNPVQPVDAATTNGNLRAQRGEIENGTVPGGSEPWSDYMVPRLTLYFPLQNGTLQVDPSAVKAGRYDDRLFRQLVLPAEHKQRIMALADRALNPATQAALYDKMGMAAFCQKGRGAICMLYGLPGTGKTMTAEAVSDKLKRPLIRVQVGGAFNPDDISRLLGEAFRKAERYNAVLLIDEADIFIRKRGEQPMLDGVVAGFLRALEYYKGLLFLTTNLVGDIDPAVFSRAHMVLGYESPDAVEVWGRLMPAEVRGALHGGDDAWVQLLGELAKVPLNGREIKTVIQNAVTRAASGRTELPVGKWINAAFFLEEAKALFQTREDLRK